MKSSPLHRAGSPRTHKARFHRTVAVAGVLALALLGSAACGKKGGDDPQAHATANTVITDAPTASATASASAAATPQPTKTGGGSGSNTTTFPSSAKDYGLAALAAWAGGSKSKLDLYAEQAAVAQFMGHGKPNSQWTNTNCAAQGSGQTACTYRNAHGDDSQITMKDTQLGHPTAVVDVFINKTVYGNTAADYVGHFMAAWGDKNKQRMTRYANSTIANAFLGKTPPTGSQTEMTQNGSSWTVKVTGLPLGSGYWTFTVDGGKLGTGGAITAAKEG